MARGFALAMGVVLVLGGVAAVAYQAGAAAAGAAGSTVATAYPYMWHPFFGFGSAFLGLLFPLFFLFLVFGLARAAFGGGWGHHDGRRRMLEQWHHEMHERQGSGTPEH